MGFLKKLKLKCSLWCVCCKMCCCKSKCSVGDTNSESKSV